MAERWEAFQPRTKVGLSEAVADELRSRILSGAMADGAVLPKQEDLMREYGVSKPALREALRILETEGLLEVRRGNVGGAVVRFPEPESAAYTLGLVLQSRRVPFRDVKSALSQLEPVCAGLCAARADRKRTVVPALRASQRALRGAIGRDDDDAVLAAVRAFHETIVEHCGNRVLIVLAGTLESLWSAQARAIGDSAAAAGHRHDPDFRAETVAAHDEILRNISDGDVDLAAKSARAHLETARLHAGRPLLDRPVTATMVRDHFLPGNPAKNGDSA